MDVILDLKLGYDSDTLDELLQRRRQGVEHVHRYCTFTDEKSLESYWADQAVIWHGMRTIEVGISTRFPDSVERSTASWAATLNEEPSAD